MERHGSSFQLSEKEFGKIRSLVLQETGISLSPAKTELVKRRFTPRIRALGLNGFEDYIEHVLNHRETELEHFCDAITTNLTSFFREKHHFDFLRASGIAEILDRRQNSKRIRIWSAGCSTGQEAYCLAMTFLAEIKFIRQWDLKILATDLDNKCLATGRAGLYREKDFDSMPSDLVAEYFHRVERAVRGEMVGFYQADNRLKELITFNKLNMLGEWPMKGKFDVIFCRNVFIYFNKETQTRIIERFAQLQDPGDYLCLGHSESIANPKGMGYQLQGKTLYIKQ